MNKKLLKDWKFWLVIALVVIIYFVFFYKAFCIPCLEAEGTLDVPGICHTLYQQLTGTYAIC